MAYTLGHTQNSMYFPFLYLPIAATLRRLDPAIEDVAQSLGLKPWAVFFRVVDQIIAYAMRMLFGVGG